MNQVGMTLPGGRSSRGPAPDIYTVLMFGACVALLGACAFVGLQATKVSKDGNPMTPQLPGERISLPSGR
ncbi:MAG: hypothetical protein AAGB51_11240 [Planctomycetota bacterium]